LPLLILSQKRGFSKKKKKFENSASTEDRGKYVNFACCPFVAALCISNGFLGAFANLRKSDY